MAEQKLGSVGEATETYAKGVATASVAITPVTTAFGLSLSGQLNVSQDAALLIAYLAAKIGGPVPAEIASFLETALKL